MPKVTQLISGKAKIVTHISVALKVQDGQLSRLS